MGKFKIGLIGYYAVCIALYFFLLSHKSVTPWFLEYSKPYSIFLLALLTLFFLPLLWRWLVAKWGRRTILFSLIPAGLLSLIAYLAAAAVYYHTRLYNFDPFLQIPPHRFQAGQGAAFRIMALGGSTTRFSTYPSELEKILKTHYAPLDIEVLNAGMPFWTTRHSLINYVTYGESLKPDLVLVMHAINDIVRSCTSAEYTLGAYEDDWSHFYGPAINAAKARTFEAYLFQRFYLGLIYTLSGDGGIDYPLEKFVSIRPFAENLRRLTRYVKESGAELIFITQPSMLREKHTAAEHRLLRFGPVFCGFSNGFLTRAWPSTASMARAMAAFNETTRKTAAAGALTLIDAAPQIGKNLENFKDDVHATDLGGARLGRIVAEAVIASGIIDRSQSIKNMSWADFWVE